MVELSYTEEWKAPEVRADNTILTLRDAKKTDVYSFGKLCDWLLSLPGEEGQLDEDLTGGVEGEALSELLAKSRHENSIMRPNMYLLRRGLSVAAKNCQKQR